MGVGEGGLQDAIYERAVGGKPLRKWERGVGLDRCIQYTTTVSADDVNNHKKEFSNPFSVMETEANLYFVPASILVSRDCARFGQHQKSRPRRGSNFLSIRREFVSYSQSIRFVTLAQSMRRVT